MSRFFSFLVNRLYSNQNCSRASRSAVAGARESQIIDSLLGGLQKHEKEGEELKIASGLILSKLRICSRLYNIKKSDATTLFLRKLCLLEK